MSTTITMPASQSAALPSDLRNSIYSSLLSSGGIRNIESTLTQLLQTTGFQATLRTYITELFRTGQATSAPEAYAIAMNRIKESMTDDAERANGTNGTNGVNGGGDDGDDTDLKLPKEVIIEGTKCVKKELERVVEVTLEDK
jgi:hypothetical protein